MEIPTNDLVTEQHKEKVKKTFREPCPMNTVGYVFLSSFASVFIRSVNWKLTIVLESRTGVARPGQLSHFPFGISSFASVHWLLLVKTLPLIPDFYYVKTLPLIIDSYYVKTLLLRSTCTVPSTIFYHLNDPEPFLLYTLILYLSHRYFCKL